MIRDTASFQILLDTIARLVREKLIPREREVTDADEIPTDIMAEMRRMGLFGLTKLFRRNTALSFLDYVKGYASLNPFASSEVS